MKPIGIAISNFRSVGIDPVELDLRKRVIVLAGANNSGKSTVLRAVEFFNQIRTHTARTQDQAREWQRENFPFCQETQYFRVRLDYQAVPGELGFPTSPNVPTTSFRVELVVKAPGDIEVASETLSEWRLEENKRLDAEARAGRISGGKPLEDLKETVNRFANTIKRDFLRIISQDQVLYPHVIQVPEYRRVTAEAMTGFNWCAGAGIVGELGRWQRAGTKNFEELERFQELERLLNRLTGRTDLRLQVPEDKKHIVVVDGRRVPLPLEFYGTGVHQLITLAAVALRYPTSLICIEEPELHLHPRFQRELLRFAQQTKDTTFLMTSHSPTIINPGAGVEVIHMTVKDGVARGQPVCRGRERLDLLEDLGVRATDLLHANSVIWVEGPSDRILLRHWLSLVAPDLREGVHFTVMYFGGACEAGVEFATRDEDTAYDPERLVPLLRINQHSMIIVDSDRGTADAPLKPHVERIARECAESGVICWITEGREIENYVPPGCILAALRGLDATQFTFGRYDRIEDSIAQACAGQRRYAKKVPRARSLAATFSIEDLVAQPDLSARINSLVERIRLANR